MSDTGFARSFYGSRAWKLTRKAYKDSVLICERCRQRGIFTPGEHVHHKIRLTPENISNEKISLSFDNLELLCEPCHQTEHRRESEERWRVNMIDGHVTLQ